ncbi:MAG: alanine--tRNA ligase [Chloroflexi bacterium]|nr:alanine--tRNA ligase [Chloroflexota bacterium]
MSMTADQIRQAFLDYFQARGHLLMPSSSLIPAGDPTLLLTTAGMVQFKPYFTGLATPPSRRLTSCQKCFRTTDIDAAGDYKHLTFFEMLGNFSVGDYFKEGAIQYAWEFVTGHLRLPPSRLWVTIYRDDEEAFRLWHERMGVPAERIYRYGERDNWWGPAGLEGPCGPCSEIHYDFGREHGCGDMATVEEVAQAALQPIRPFDDAQGRQAQGERGEEVKGCHPNCDRCGRFVELWNLVFMQFFQDADKKRSPLPVPNIDTGMGLERAATVVQGKHTVYDTDLFQQVIGRLCDLTGKSYGQDKETDYAIRVVAEHARGATFLINDGVVPANEGRGYVLRRIIRRAIRYGRQLGLGAATGSARSQILLPHVARAVIERMEGQYPDLKKNEGFILRVLELEEERFGQVYGEGKRLLENAIIAHNQVLETIAGLVSKRIDVEVGKARAHGGGTPPGRLLKDAYLILKEAGDSLKEQWVQGVFQEFKLGELQERVGQVLKVADQQMRRIDSLRRAQPTLEEAVSVAREAGAAVVSKLRQVMSGSLPGDVVFLLYDTYGFPPELTQEIAREHGLDVDMEGFRREMAAQRERARAAARLEGGARATADVYKALGVGATRFVGYETLIQPTVVVGLVANGEAVSQATAGQEVEVVLRETPFYAEMGGQVGDAGEVLLPKGRVQVYDAQMPVRDLTVHRGKVLEGVVALGDDAQARVDPQRRQDTARNHTATHLLHAALRQVLGTHVRQAGSLVAPDRLRFDFSHIAALSPEEMWAVESMVNERIRMNVPVRKRETGYAQAVQEGALAFFGDMYGERVRVVEVANGEPFSVEVCGGTHVERTGDIGLFLITSEQSIGSGARRIEAVTGRFAEVLIRERFGLLESVAQVLKGTPQEVEAKVKALVDALEGEWRRRQALERELARRDAEALLSAAREVDGVKVLVGRMEVSSVEALREVGDHLRDRLKSGILVLGAVLEERPVLVAMVTKDLVSKGYDAVRIVREAAYVMGGSGGGRPELAQAGGRHKEKLAEALGKVAEIVRRSRGKP